MDRNHFSFFIDGDYTDYQIQQLIAERIFALQGNQNQTFKVRSIVRVNAHRWQVNIFCTALKRRPNERREGGERRQQRDNNERRQQRDNSERRQHDQQPALPPTAGQPASDQALAALAQQELATGQARHPSQPEAAQQQERLASPAPATEHVQPQQSEWHASQVQAGASETGQAEQHDSIEQHGQPEPPEQVDWRAPQFQPDPAEPAAQQQAPPEPIERDSAVEPHDTQRVLLSSEDFDDLDPLDNEPDDEVAGDQPEPTLAEDAPDGEIDAEPEPAPSESTPDDELYEMTGAQPEPTLPDPDEADDEPAASDPDEEAAPDDELYEMAGAQPEPAASDPGEEAAPDDELYEMAGIEPEPSPSEPDEAALPSDDQLREIAGGPLDSTLPDPDEAAALHVTPDSVSDDPSVLPTPQPDHPAEQPDQLDPLNLYEGPGE